MRDFLTSAQNLRVSRITRHMPGAGLSEVLTVLSGGDNMQIVEYTKVYRKECEERYPHPLHDWAEVWWYVEGQKVSVVG
jgi:hypothetical protein